MHVYQCVDGYACGYLFPASLCVWFVDQCVHVHASVCASM